MDLGVGSRFDVARRFTLVLIVILIFSVFDIFSVVVVEQGKEDSADISSEIQEALTPTQPGKTRAAEPAWSPLSGSLPSISDYYGMDFGDVNNDGMQDIVVSSGQFTSDGVHCFLGDGSGTWTENSSGLPVGGWYADVELADFNNDGKLDIACGGFIWTGDGGAGGEMTWTSQTGPGPCFGVALGDVNNDGITDIACGTNNWGVRVYTSNGGAGGPFVWTNSSQLLPTSGQYYGVALADINNDGKLDLAAANNDYNGIKVWTGNGESGFATAWTDATGIGLPATGDYSQVRFGDADNDGKLDLAAAKRPGGVKVWKGNGGEGGFTWAEESTGLATDGRFYGLQFGDVNNDGKLDLVSGNYSFGGIGVWLGDGGEGGSMDWNDAKDGLPMGTDALDICLGDVNNDGRLDIGATSESEGLQVWAGNLPDLEITGWIEASTNLPTSTGWYDVVFGDVNHDGMLDLAATSCENEGVNVWLGDGTGLWTEIADPDLASSGYYNGLRLADVNHDGDLDVIAANDTGGRIKIWPGDGDGGFGPYTEPGDPISPPPMGGVEVADFNNDGDLDLGSCYYDPGNPDSLVFTWLGDGTGGFPAETGPPELLGYDDVAFGDVDHDGNLDLFATGHMNGYRFWLGNGLGGWTLNPQNGLPLTSSGLGASFGDLNHDGHLDIAIATWAPGNLGVRVFTSNGAENGSVWWTEESSGLPTSEVYGGMELEDIDRDGNLDILTNAAWSNGNGVDLYLGNGGEGGSMTWTDTRLPNLPFTGDYWGVAYGDVNNDGVQDIAITSDADGVQVFITQFIQVYEIDLLEGWNLISLPLIQSDTTVGNVLASIDGDYKAVQCYDPVDVNDLWEHYNPDKSPQANDLSDVDHTVGIWIYITQPGGTTLTVNGSEISSVQSITIRPGWNLVGFPSRTDKPRDLALDTVLFGTDVDWVGYFDAEKDTFVTLSDTDNMELTRGYWIHSIAQNDIVWNVPI
jgi:hypothetical protein